jgi:hypothetical protein
VVQRLQELPVLHCTKTEIAGAKVLGSSELTLGLGAQTTMAVARELENIEKH